VNHKAEIGSKEMDSGLKTAGKTGGGCLKTCRGEVDDVQPWRAMWGVAALPFSGKRI
jgi:hypothetical protein